jgi:hypothetical protein
LAIVCHALRFARQTVAKWFLLTHQGGRAMQPGRFEEALAFLNYLTEERTRPRSTIGGSMPSISPNPLRKNCTEAASIAWTSGLRMSQSR